MQPSTRVEGHIGVPGDKSVSHRALMLGAIAEGTSHVTGFLPGEDCLATMAAVRAMGIEVVQHDATTIDVAGQGLQGLRAAGRALDMGNSGTAMRLFMGLLAAQPFATELFGDASLSRRPMERVAEPLRRMGARVDTTNGTPPVRIAGGSKLRGISFDMPVASAQVKSAVLLAGLYAGGETSVSEPAVTRDHTERMLARLGYPVQRSGSTVTIAGGGRLVGGPIAVPGDLSSAAFMVLAGCLASAGELVVDRVGLNPTRTGILRILELMGADLRIEESPGGVGEPVGRLIVRPCRLRGIDVPPELVPLAIDEFPVIFVAAALAGGETVVRGASELRHKETDRIRVMADGLRTLGIEVEELPDGARIRGGRFRSGTVDSAGDHRVAMSFAVGASRAEGPVTILDTANVATSYPGFAAEARGIGLDVVVTGDE
ncbi:MAG: 3-phosphoshikimate 1-carboxyvinyltransferase [Chromatiales bacterium]|nr:3-phosphoshikimate 1-carboxyvinyltransferase [Chromatiales bacterium]